MNASIYRKWHVCDVNVLPKLTNGDALPSSSSYYLLLVVRCRWLRQCTGQCFTCRVQRKACFCFISLYPSLSFSPSLSPALLLLFPICCLLLSCTASSDSFFSFVRMYLCGSDRARTERFMGGRQNQYTVIKKRCTVRVNSFFFVFVSFASFCRQFVIIPNDRNIYKHSFGECAWLCVCARTVRFHDSNTFRVKNFIREHHKR